MFRSSSSSHLALPPRRCLWFCCCADCDGLIGGGGSERYGNGDQGQWDVALEALMAWLSADLHVTLESIYSLHLIHELQAGMAHRAALWDLFSLDPSKTWGLYSCQWAAGEEVPHCHKPYFAGESITVWATVGTVTLVICEPRYCQPSVIFNT